MIWRHISLAFVTRHYYSSIDLMSLPFEPPFAYPFLPLPPHRYTHTHTVSLAFRNVAAINFLLVYTKFNQLKILSKMVVFTFQILQSNIREPINTMFCKYVATCATPKTVDHFPHRKTCQQKLERRKIFATKTLNISSEIFDLRWVSCVQPTNKVINSKQAQVME